jgi:short-subunit dehydrogenase
MFGGVINLIEHFLPKMKEKDSGRVVIISSIGALIPMPKSSIYAAVKSGIYSYGRSLNEELENTNVSVTVSLPGYVRTNIHNRSGLEHLTKKIPNWMWISADKVVADTEKASKKGKSHIIPGFLYRITSIFFNLKITKIIWKTLNARK